MVFISPKYSLRPPVKHETSTTNQYDGPPIISNPAANTPLHLYSEFTYGYPVIDQVDLVPTLSTLFGFPIPKNNLGKVILDLYGGNSEGNIEQKKKILQIIHALMYVYVCTFFFFFC
jgi:ethanolaminephosphotransferase